MANVKRHMQANIEGMLKQFKGKHGKKLSFMDKDDGTPATYDEARTFLWECQRKGWKLIPCGDCEGFDHFGGGCPGHPIEETDPETQDKETP